MKKIHNLKLFGLVAFLAFALVFIDFSEGQVRTTRGKPENPPGNPDNPNKALGMKKLEDYRITPIFPGQPVSDPQISPDGTKVLFTYTTANVKEDRYHSHIWLLPLDEKEPKQFTYGNGNDSHPRWSPDGKTILFLSDRSSEENKPGMQIFVIPADGGEARCLTSVEEGVERPTWSPDGKNILFLSNVFNGERAKGSDVKIIRSFPYKTPSEREFIDDRWRHLFSVRPESGQVKQLTDGEFNINMVDWSPDGSRVVFFSRGRIYTISSKGGDPELLWKGGGNPIRSLDWSPDGEYIAFGRVIEERDPHGRHVYRNTDIWVLPVKGGEPKCLTADFDRTVARGASVKWSPDSQYVYVKFPNHGTRHIHRVSLEGEVEALTEGKLNIDSFTMDEAGKVFAFNASGPMTPSELWILDDGGQAKRTEMNRTLLRKLRLVEPEEFWFTASDGVKVQGWIIKPHELKEGEKYPMVSYIHGGPRGGYRYGLRRGFQVLAEHGFAVVYTNYRGSTGYGESFAADILFVRSAEAPDRWGDRDYRDIMEAIDYVIETYPFVDPERLGVAGGSYGGFMTNWIIAHTDRFKTAISMASMTNHFSYHGSPHEISEMKEPWDDPQMFIEKSPITYVKNMKTPLLLIHSELDWVCPIEQAEMLFIALKKLNRVVEFVSFPGEGHGIKGPKHIVERQQHIVRWFDRYLR